MISNSKSDPTCITTDQGGTVLWDGDCGFCTITQHILKEKDTLSRLKFRKLQEINLSQYGSNENLEFDTLYFISKEGVKFTHARAVFEAMAELTGFWGALGHVFANQFFGLIGYPLYRFISRNRRRISYWLRLNPDVKANTGESFKLIKDN